MTSAKRYPIVGVFVVFAESRDGSPKLGSRFGRGLVVVGMMGLVRFNVSSHCEPPLPAPLSPIPTVGLHCQPHCQITLWGPTASPTAT